MIRSFFVGNCRINHIALDSGAYYEYIGCPVIKGDRHVNVLENDKILLAKYLWEQNNPQEDYNQYIGKYLISLKPHYTIDEIMSILTELKSEVRDKDMLMSVKVSQKYKRPISLR